MSDEKIDDDAGKPLSPQRGLKPGLRIRVENSPCDEADVVGLANAELDLVGPSAVLDLAHAFVATASELDASIRSLAHRLLQTGFCGYRGQIVLAPGYRHHRRCDPSPCSAARPGRYQGLRGRRDLIRAETGLAKAASRGKSHSGL